MPYLHSRYALYHEHSGPPIYGVPFDILEFHHQDLPDATGSFSFDGYLGEYIEPSGEEFQPFLQGHYDDVAHTIVIHNTGFGGTDIAEHMVFSGRTINSSDNAYVAAMTGTFHRLINISLETGAEGIPRPSDPPGVWSTWDTYMGVWAAAWNPADAVALEAEGERLERVATFIPRRG